MANIKNTTPITPININKFLGLNISNTGDTQIKMGESGNMTNWLITEDYKLEKMYGYKTIENFNSQINGKFYGKINDEHYFLISAGGKLYRYINNNKIEISELPNKETTFFSFDNKIYILTGDKYLSFDGEIVEEVEGYIPLVFISSNPAGGGTSYENINMLNSKRHQTFNGDGTSTEFNISEENVYDIYKVLVNGEEITNYTKDLTIGKIILETAPIKAMDNVDIYWQKDLAFPEERKEIEQCKAGIIFGGDVDTRIFLYGNEKNKNKIYFSTYQDGIPTAEYFDPFSYAEIGVKNYAVTDLRRHYDKLLATTEKDAYTVSITQETLVDERVTTTLVINPLNEVVGNYAFNQGQVIDNDPITFFNGIVRWKSSSVRDERNMSKISSRIDSDLLNYDLRQLKSLDYQEKKQLWISLNNKIWIYNYGNDTFSRVLLPIELTGMIEVNGKILAFEQTGKMLEFDKNYQTFDGEIIKAYWEMNYSDFGIPYLRKTMNKMWVVMQPQANSGLEISYITNRNQSSSKKQISTSILLLDEVDFRNFSFKISTNPQPFKLKLKAKKFTHLKIILENNDESDATVLSLSLKVEAGGESK